MGYQFVVITMNIKRVILFGMKYKSTSLIACWAYSFCQQIDRYGIALTKKICLDEALIIQRIYDKIDKSIIVFALLWNRNICGPFCHKRPLSRVIVPQQMSSYILIWGYLSFFNSMPGWK
jgi:hypothetical protein